MPEAKYLVISPAKNEEKYIEKTIEQMIKQTVRPRQWIVVNDGSTDNTREIVERYSREHQWMKIVDRDDRGYFEPGRGIVQAFNAGYAAVDCTDYDFVVKFDCDLLFEPDYFERLLLRFQNDEKLGIASGVYLERKGSHWVPVEMPDYHAAGASKVMRRECFEQIGGYVANRGWDTIDEIRAQMLGWKTRHFKDLQLYHLKAGGSNVGSLRTYAMHGEIFYLTGGGKLFLVLKVIHRMIEGSPFLFGGLMVLWGYLKSLLTGRQLLVTQEEAGFYRRLLNSRIARALGVDRLLGWP